MPEPGGGPSAHRDQFAAEHLPPEGGRAALRNPAGAQPAFLFVDGAVRECEPVAVGVAEWWDGTVGR